MAGYESFILGRLCAKDTLLVQKASEKFVTLIERVAGLGEVGPHLLASSGGFQERNEYV